MIRNLIIGGIFLFVALFAHNYIHAQTPTTTGTPIPTVTSTSTPTNTQTPTSTLTPTTKTTGSPTPSVVIPSGAPRTGHGC